MAHALLSPSSAARWMACPGSAWLCSQIKGGSDGGSFASEGTYAHEVAAALLNGQPIPARPEGLDTDPEAVANELTPYLNYVRSLPSTRLIEQCLPISRFTGEAGAFGAADCVALDGDELIVVDLKFGRGVKVEAMHNPQLLIYAGAAFSCFDFAADIKRVRMVIVQPRLANTSEWTLSTKAFKEALSEIRICADRALEQVNTGEAGGEVDLRPARSTCQFCRAAARCTAYAAMVAKATGVPVPVAAVPMLDDIGLAGVLSHVDAVKQWCQRVEEDALATMLAGRKIPGWKLVSGREGPRKWTDEQAADTLLKGMKLPVDQRYTKKLMTPTQALKLFKTGGISEHQWLKLEALTTRSEAKPAIAPIDDKRPKYLKVTAADLPNV